MRVSAVYTERHHPALLQMQASTPPAPKPVSLSQTGMGTVDRAEVLRPDCSSSNPGPESWASEMGRMLVSTEQGCTEDVS